MTEQDSGAPSEEAKATEDAPAPAPTTTAPTPTTTAPAEAPAGAPAPTPTTTAPAGASGEAAEESPPEAIPLPFKTQAILLGVLVTVSLIGAGFNLLSEAGAWECWIVACVVYAGVGVGCDVLAQKGWRKAGRHALHWLGTLACLELLLMLERNDVINRSAAANAAVLMVALSAFHAGLHLQRLFLWLALFLSVLTIVLGYVQEVATAALVLVPVAAVTLGVPAYMAYQAKSAAGGANGDSPPDGA